MLTNATIGLVVTLASAAWASHAAARGSHRPASPFGGEQVYAVAMHQHGSMSEGDGSMEWHAQQAFATSAADVIWWTDHDWRVSHWSHTTRFDFEGAPVALTPLIVSEPDEDYPGETRSFKRTVLSGSFLAAVVDSVAAQGARSWRLEEIDDTGQSLFRTTYFAQRGSRKQQMFSLAARVRVRFSLYAEAFGPDSKFVLQAQLSEHPTESHELRYVIGSMDGEGASAISLPLVPGQWHEYEVDLTADAIAAFTSGGIDTLRAEDNNMFETSIGVASRNGAITRVFFDDYQVLHDASLDGNPLLDKARAFGDLYEAMYPTVSHFVGTEISRYRAQPHMNGYAPNLSLVDYTGTVHSDSLYYAVDQIHAQGGCVSLNHVFGTGLLGPIETPEEKAARIRYEKRRLIATRVWGADLLEVGYRIRNGVDLLQFLETWDAVTGNAIFVTGNGVTDSHGRYFFDGWGPYDPGNPYRLNNFVTFIYANESSEAALIDGLLGGRAFFGDPFAYEGSLDLATTDGFPMGRIVLTDRDDHDLVVRATDVSPTVELRLVQGEIRENPSSEYLVANVLRDESLGGTVVGGVFADTVSIDTTVPSFLRVELRENGQGVAYSNPIHFVRDVPGVGIPPRRVGASLDSTRILAADRFTLLDASFDSGPLVLDLSGDEDGVGLGTLEIAPGSLGAPSAVVGAAQWDFDGARLVLSGFSGTSSSVQVSWGTAVAAPDTDRPAALALVVRNPFVDRARVRCALPRASQVFLEVLDVQGRRVRVLVDERREAGFHDETWDGRDPYGRPVAAGVYFLRLSASGESLTEKAVKIR
jgi:hypothetical protein